ncbi:complement C1q-like protein 4 isoform 1-T1 [Menidia menidia]
MRCATVRMKTALVLQLFMVFCSVCMDQTEAVAADLQEAFSPDVHASLRAMVASLTEQRLELRALRKESKEKIERHEAEIERLKKELEENKERQEAEIASLKKQLEVPQVAFSASLSDRSRNFGLFKTYTTLVFESVQTNIGNAYNSKTGIFVAPVKGAFHFVWYIYGNGGGKNSGASLVKNGERIFIAYQNGIHHHGTTSNGVTLLLESGDQVYVQQWPNTQIYDSINRHTTFSGHLLFTV